MEEEEEETKKIILANPKSFSRAFSFLVKKFAQEIGRGDANYAAYNELASNEMPPDFLTWYYTPSSDPKFKKFEMFRRTHKISAIDVMKENKKVHHDPFDSPRGASQSKPKSKSKSGGRKRRTRTQMQSQVRRQKRRTNRRR